VLKQQPFGQRKGEQETTKMQINTRKHLIHSIQTTAVFVASHLAKSGRKMAPYLLRQFAKSDY